jgi:hypothetical protein
MRCQRLVTRTGQNQILCLGNLQEREHITASPKLDNTIKAEGARGGAVVEALRYKPEVRGFESRLSHWSFFIDINLPAVLCLWDRHSL